MFASCSRILERIGYFWRLVSLIVPEIPVKFECYEALRTKIGKRQSEASCIIQVAKVNDVTRHLRKCGAAQGGGFMKICSTKLMGDYTNGIARVCP
jgi:hypothetical protein